MKKFVFFLVILFVVAGLHAFDVHGFVQELANAPNYGAGGGIKCAGCVSVITLLANLAEVRQQPIEKILDEVCYILPQELQSPCEEMVAKFGPAVIQYFEEKGSPDYVCEKLGICTDPTCRLWANKFPRSRASAMTSSGPRIHARPLLARDDSPRVSPWDWIKELINRVANTHLPAFDLDNDRFSDLDTLRGSSWRGKDCADLLPNVYPGRRDASGLSPNIDHNCNGIFGVDPVSGVAYEDMLCANTSMRGIMILGDSAAAHFHLPPEWLNASEIHQGTYDNLLFALENEMDWPQLSSTTGFMPSTTAVPVDSSYLRLRARNQCNHRDYQNIALNGCRSGPMASNLIKSLARSPKLDQPQLVFFSLIGNDVCDWEHSIDHMTTPAEFQANVLSSLAYLDTVLPAGSHVAFVGLADGRVLYDNMHNRTHPLGVLYSELYDFLNCLEISPCWVWMNSNATVRDAGSQRAAELSAVYPQIIATHKYNNFDMAYFDFPFAEVIERWHAMGGETWQLIEPVDGFHPNQISNWLTTQVMWDKLVQTLPGFVGPVNPNNDLITKLFGDQGGH